MSALILLVAASHADARLNEPRRNIRVDVDADADADANFALGPHDRAVLHLEANRIEKERDLISPRPYIVGGERVNGHRFPYFSSLYQEFEGDNYHVCGGALISDSYVLTAAHCAKHAHRARIGAYTELSDPSNDNRPFHDTEVIKAVTHPDFYSDSKDRLHYDFALLKLREPVTDPYLLQSAMNLERVIEVDEQLKNGEIRNAVTTIGLGRLHESGPLPKFLQEVELKYVDNDICKRYFGDVPEVMMCAKEDHQDACTGDSGGPLIVKGNTPNEDVQVGIVSWGSGCATTFPGVYSRISRVGPWIKQEVCKNSLVEPPYCSKDSKIPMCVEHTDCKANDDLLPGGLWCFLNANICQITCGKCEP